MLSTRNPVDVLSTLSNAQRLLTEEAERLRHLAISQADHVNCATPRASSGRSPTRS